MMQAGSGVGMARVEVEVTIGAPRERVWRALVEETGQWWPSDFYVGQSPRGFILEARPGGRVYEDWGNEAGALWYTVLVVEPPAVLEHPTRGAAKCPRRGCDTRPPAGDLSEGSERTAGTRTGARGRPGAARTWPPGGGSR